MQELGELKEDVYEELQTDAIVFFVFTATYDGDGARRFSLVVECPLSSKGHKGVLEKAVFLRWKFPVGDRGNKRLRKTRHVGWWAMARARLLEA